MGTWANSEDPEEMPHNAAFYLSLHCLLKKLDLQKEMQNILEIIPSDPSIYTMDHTDFIVCSFVENSIGLKGIIELVFGSAYEFIIYEDKYCISTYIR